MKWINVNDKLPDRNTRYASKYGVSVLGFDISDHRPEPFEVIFNYGKKWFEELCHGPAGEECWLSASVSHWMELPKGVK